MCRNQEIIPVSGSLFLLYLLFSNLLRLWDTLYIVAMVAFNDPAPPPVTVSAEDDLAVIFMTMPPIAELPDPDERFDATSELPLHAQFVVGGAVGRVVRVGLCGLAEINAGGVGLRGGRDESLGVGPGGTPARSAIGAGRWSAVGEHAGADSGIGGGVTRCGCVALRTNDPREGWCGVVGAGEIGGVFGGDSDWQPLPPSVTAVAVVGHAQWLLVLWGGGSTGTGRRCQRSSREVGSG
ncbi:MAG: hypothetical protein J6386_16450 [Candidatus Synoicihabitans palmerolidicus]|nr:hypothetical protein [Candidatus Synoicihabitans palmerolidicus]